VKSASQHIESAVHYAIILIAILISIVFVKSYLLSDTKLQSSNSRNANAAAAPNMPTEAGMIGKTLTLPNMNWEKNGHTLLFFLSTILQGER
jgi:hypothetical protein